MLSVTRPAGPMATPDFLSSGMVDIWMALEMRNDVMVRDMAMQNRIHPNQGICGKFIIVKVREEFGSFFVVLAGH